MTARILALFALLLFMPAAASAAPAACAPSVQDRLWMQHALDGWTHTARTHLRIYAADPPSLIFFDARCVYRAGEGATGKPMADGPRFAGRRIPWAAAPHGGQVALPGGGEVPAGVVSFAAPWKQDTRQFMIMSLPSVWREGGVRSALGLETLMTAVFIHEMTHTRQLYALSPRLAALEAKYNLPDDIDDDSLQEAFKRDPEYVAAWTAERDDLLTAVALAWQSGVLDFTPQSRAAAASAYERAQARRARWFTGDNAKWAELEDAFLTMEGMGQWAAWSWLTDSDGGAVNPSTALPLFRRGGRFWSQDEGFLVMLVVDCMLPDWRERAFAAEPEQIYSLWERAVR